MAIVHVVDRVKAGHGWGLTALAIVEAQHRAGWNVRLLVSGVQSPGLLPDAPCHEPLLGDWSTEVHRDVGAIDSVARALERMTEPCDTIVGHEGVDLAAACRLQDRRVVGAVHSHPDECLAYLPAPDLRLVARRADHWIAWGRVVAARLGDLGVDEKRITISGQSVGPDRSRARRMAGSPACLTVARLDPVKNHLVMLGALALLSRPLPDVHWHMLGGCDESAHLRRLQDVARLLGVAERVTWHGYREDVAATMLGCDVTVLASHSEGVPRAIQEAMALGVPTVMPAALASDLVHAGLPVTFGPNEPEALAHAISAALVVDSERRAAAARWVTKTWGWEKVLADWQRAVTGDRAAL